MGCVKRKRPAHKFSGEKWVTNSTNKKYLAIDFNCRCAYCDDLDFYYGGKRSFHVDHFAPKEKFPELKFTYENLLYSCPYCNTAKSDTWPSDDSAINIVGDIGFISPCSEEYDNHLERDINGKITARTKLGIYMIEELKLYLYRHELFFKLEQVEEKKKMLEHTIQNEKREGKDVSAKQSALDALTHDFFGYYAEWKSLPT